LSILGAFYKTIASILSSKGDILGFSTTEGRLAVGANDTVLTADSGEALGIKWASSSGGLVIPTFSELTLDSNGDIVWTSDVVSYNQLDSFGDASTDTLNHATGGALGELHRCVLEDGSRDITIADAGGGTGRIRISTSFTLAELLETWTCWNSRQDSTQENETIVSGYT